MEMITEIVELHIKPDSNRAFEKAIADNAGLFERTNGCKGMRLRRSVETPTHYRMFVLWNHIDDHLVGFKNSAELQEWRKAIGPFFASPPEIEHFETVDGGFGEA